MATAKLITAFGESKSLNAWAQDPRCKVSRQALQKRLASGLDPEAAITSGATPQVRTTTDKRPKAPKTSPLSAHASGHWRGRIGGEDVYVGKWEDGVTHQVALAEYNRLLGLHLNTGQDVRHLSRGATLGYVVNHFLEAMETARDNGEIGVRTFKHYEDEGKRLAAFFGKSVKVMEIGVDDLARYRNELTVNVTTNKVTGRKNKKKAAPATVGNRVRVARIIFQHAFDSELIPVPVNVVKFKEPTKKVKKRARREKQEKNGLRLIEAGDLRTLLDNADRNLRAFILLGINGGMGAKEISEIPATLLGNGMDLDGGLMKWARPKTEESRMFHLWPETVEAIREVLKHQPATNKREDPSRMFHTKYGKLWVRIGETWNEDGIGKAFAKLLRAQELKREGLGFYALRHTFQTVAEEQMEIPDPQAVKVVMGHADQSMSAAYRERFSPKRTQQATDAVRSWLFPETAAE